MPKATSVTIEGEDDGWVPPPGWFVEQTPNGDTRLVASLPADRLPQVHAHLLASLAAPLNVLYRQRVDRQNPGPQTAPPRDFVSIDVEPGALTTALASASPLIHEDARCELWVRGRMGEQVVLDADGLLYMYPDDPSFRDALDEADVAHADVQTMADRDYVKHWFDAACDPMEAAFIETLGLVEVPPQRG